MTEREAVYTRMHTAQRPSFWEELKQSSVTTLIGICLYLCGIVLLFWNEGRAVQRARSLDEGLEAVIRIKDPEILAQENEGKLVHIMGRLDIPEMLTETAYGIAIAAVKLKRRVQMFQWIEEETSRKISNSDQTETSYNYITDWRDSLIDSSRFYIPFNHENPSSLPLQTETFVSDVVRLGGFHLSPRLKQKFARFTTFTSDERPVRSDIKLHGNIFYHSEDVFNPRVGDIRVQFSYAGRAGATVSVVGRQVGSSVEGYTTTVGDELLMLYEGGHTPNEMFAAEKSSNSAFTWLLRMAGSALLFIGLSCITRILNVLVSRFPLVRDVVALGVTSLNVTITISTSLIVTAAGWVWYRPLLALLLVACAALPIIWRAYRTPTDSRHRRRM